MKPRIRFYSGLTQWSTMVGYRCWLLLLMTPLAYADLTPKTHIGIAGIDFQSQVGMEYGQDSNVTYQYLDDQALESNYSRLTSKLQMTGQRYTDTYQLRYMGDYLAYDNAKSDDKYKHDFNMNGEWWYGLRHSLQININDTIDREERGRGLTEGFQASQFIEYGIDEAINTNFFYAEARYSYGAPKGRGSLQFALLQKRLRFNELDSVEDTDVDFYDYIVDQEWNENSVVAELFDKTSEETRFRYTLLTNQRRYEDTSKDTNEYYAFYGVVAQITGKSLIDAQIEWLYKEFIRSSSGQPFNGLNWEFKWEWQPVQHSTLKLYSNRTIKDPTESGEFIEETDYGIAWKHYLWVDHFYTQLEYHYIDDKYKNDDDNRRDKRNIYGFSLGYDFRQSINIQLKYQLDRLRSNLDQDIFYIGSDNDIPVTRTLGFDNSLVMLTVKVQI
ncbi:MAG: hypothetical protein WBM99_14570 [Psychromonas sp.]